MQSNVRINPSNNSSRQLLQISHYILEPEEEPRGKRRRVEDGEADGGEAANNDATGDS